MQTGGWLKLGLSSERSSCGHVDQDFFYIEMIIRVKVDKGFQYSCGTLCTFHGSITGDNFLALLKVGSCILELARFFHEQ